MTNNKLHLERLTKSRVIILLTERIHENYPNCNYLISANLLQQSIILPDIDIQVAAGQRYDEVFLVDWDFLE
ncbi:MAG TPA: hypothetical protein ENJ32_10815 [Crenotrichaceae bacterium]|nr:hypothetical protein [Crenotrichaceae bacterium]